MKILLTGFEPFDDFVKNSSYESIKVFHDTSIDRFKIVAKELPVSYRRAGSWLEKYIKQYIPKIAISFGMGTESIQFESIALNINYATKKDNDGIILKNEKPIILNGPIAYFSTLPYKKIYNTLKRNRVSIVKSFHAGTYLCNNIFYHLMHFSKKYGIVRAGFFHIPPTKDCVKKGYNKPIIKMQTLRKAIDLILRVCVKDIKCIL